MKTECVKNQSTTVPFNSSQWNIIYKCFCSIQFTRSVAVVATRIPESLVVIKRLSGKKHILKI